jgi:ABC-type multidrug transport system fused ATPase/permease subunit
LEINHGEVVAIVGPSGAGKTTLVDLILGVLKADTGEILISGKSPREAVEVWPGAIAYVPQDVVITNGTIKSNVALGLNQSEDLELQIKSVLKVAQLGEFVENLPLGINEKVGDRGTKLSGGQRQRLGIARALLTEPILIVFDEATSALDGETEMIISKEIMKLKGTKTLIIIAHRLSTIREADKIVYMSGGEIISTGSLKEVRNRVPEFENQARLMGL